MDKKRDDMVSLDEFKEFFNKLSTCDFASLTEFLFQIFDTNGNTKFKLVEVSCFSNQNSAHNNLNFCIILQFNNGIRILDKKAADHQSFQEFESADLIFHICFQKLGNSMPLNLPLFSRLQYRL